MDFCGTFSKPFFSSFRKWAFSSSSFLRYNDIYTGQKSIFFRSFNQDPLQFFCSPRSGCWPQPQPDFRGTFTPSNCVKAQHYGIFYPETDCIVGVASCVYVKFSLYCVCIYRRIKFVWQFVHMSVMDQSVVIAVDHSPHAEHAVKCELSMTGSY